MTGSYAADEYRGQLQIPVAAVADTCATRVHLLKGTDPLITCCDGEMSGPTSAIPGDPWSRLREVKDASTSSLTH